MVDQAAVEIDPRGEHRFSVLWLHGLGADGHDFLPIVEELGVTESLGLRFVFPHAGVRPVTVNGGYPMRAWYDIVEPNLTRRIDRAGIAESVQYLEHLIEQERRRFGLDMDRILLAGFSQGGVIALCTALGLPEPPRGLLVLSSYWACAELPAGAAESAALHVFQGHGRQDPVVPMTLGRAARDRLTARGHRVEWREYDMPHAVCPQEIEDLRVWLIDRLDSA